MNTEEIKGLIQAMDNSEITELDMETEGFRLRLKKGVNTVALGQPPMESVPRQPVPVTAVERELEDDENHVIITAPMVGTFYRAPGPDSPAYVQVGEEIQRGQPLCIIEAMKLMNEIESDVGGQIKEILVENAQPVEFGQPLFVVEKLD